jgi:hypothetical protein
MAIAKEIARCMLERVTVAPLYQDNNAARNIRVAFDERFTQKNGNTNWAISKDVLDEFAKLTGNTVVWERSSRRWRMRREGDKPGRQQRRCSSLAKNRGNLRQFVLSVVASSVFFHTTVPTDG